MRNNKKENYVDDGHTIYNMNVDGVRGYHQDNKNNDINLSKKEKHAMIKAAFCAYIPKLFIMLVGFGLAILLLYFWLK